jgi:hypothetical protein
VLFSVGPEVVTLVAKNFDLSLDQYLLQHHKKDDNKNKKKQQEKQEQQQQRAFFTSTSTKTIKSNIVKINNRNKKNIPNYHSSTLLFVLISMTTNHFATVLFVVFHSVVGTLEHWGLFRPVTYSLYH